MKYFKFFFLLTLCLSMNSCDEEEILEFFEDPELDITTNFVFNMTISSPMVSDPTERVYFNDIVAYDIISNPQVAEEIGEPERIKKVVINSVVYEFKNFSGNVDAEVRGSLGFPGPDGEDINFDMAEVNAAEADLLNNVYSINANFSGISERATSLKGIGCVYFGSSSHNPVDFSLQVIVNATITVEVNLDDL
jgi:hypothetical protein